MEGSRHERVSIVLTSYAIGFITAFILYNSSQNLVTDNVYIELPSTNSAAVAESTSPEVAVTTNNSSPSLTYGNGLLEVTVGEEKRLLSLNPVVSNLKFDLDNSAQGFHYGEVVYKLSSEENFVFFCERHLEDKSSCLGYVYDIALDRIYQVLKDGDVVTISAKSASQAIWTDDGLRIGESYSANKSAPWILISEDSQLDLR